MTSRRLPATHVFLAKQMRDLSRTLAATIPRVKERADDEAIHDMRVALRRLRVVLKLSRSIFGRFHVEAIRATFTRVHRASGALRDEEVLEETLSGLGVEAPELAAWIALRKKREDALRTIVEKRLRAGDLKRPLHALGALLSLPVAPKRRRPLAEFAASSVERAQKGVELLRDAPVENVEALHLLRIAYKRLRYTTEIFHDALPIDVAALAEPSARFQKRLGTIHDLDVARVVMDRARTLPPWVKANILDAIAKQRQGAVELYLRDQAR